MTTVSAREALMAMEALGRSPSPELLARVLAAHRPPSLLRALLKVLSEQATPELAEVVRPLTKHEDASVASAACVFRIRAAGAVASFDAEVEGRTAMVRLTGMTRAGDFARELPELLHHPKTEVRHDAIDQMGELGLALFVSPLIACLAEADSRARSADALVRFGDRAVPALAQHIDDEELHLAGRIALLKVVERIGGEPACKLLVKTCDSQDRTLRDHAVEALWRVGAQPDCPEQDRATLLRLVENEIDRLQVLSGVELLLIADKGRLERRAVLASEVSALQAATERRVFRLMGLLYDRDALQRAHLHYRSDETRARSNAIELLEQHITDPSLRGFVQLIERQEDARGNMRPRSMVVQGLDEGADIKALVSTEPWLERLWSWTTQTKRDALDWSDPLDRLAELKKMEVFADAAGAALLEVATSLERQTLPKGDRAFERGETGQDVYWVLDGEILLEPAQGDSIVVSRYQCFGELAALDGRPRCFSASAKSDVVLAKLNHRDFHDAMEVNPSVLQRLIEVLSRRLRARIA